MQGRAHQDLRMNASEIDDDRKAGGLPPEDRYCTIREVLSPVKGRAALGLIDDSA